MMSALYQTNKLRFFFLNSGSSLKQKSIAVDLSPHSDTLSAFRSDQSWLVFFHAACLAEKQPLLCYSLKDKTKFGNTNINGQIFNLVYTTRFWNNLQHQVKSKSIEWKTKFLIASSVFCNFYLTVPLLNDTCLVSQDS